jgi:N-glycosylase/DNA lyase
MSIHEEITAAYEAYLAESAKFEEKGVKASAARARKALGELGKLAKSRRAEIQDKKNEMDAKK